jgi:hypothetical protein
VLTVTVPGPPVVAMLVMFPFESYVTSTLWS